MRRRGFLLNSFVLVLLIPMLLLLATYEDISSQIVQAQSERVQIERTFRGINYLEMDFQKALEISGKRAIIAAVDYVAVTGNFISPAYKVNNTVRDLIIGGTSSSMPGYDFDRVMRGQTIEKWLINMSQELEEQGFEVLPNASTIASNMELTVAPLDSFRVVVKARIPNITIRDLSGRVVYNGSIPRGGGYIYSIVDLENLEDSFFSAMTGGRYQRSIRACLYSFPELIDKPIKVLEGDGKSSESPVIGELIRHLESDKIYFGDAYIGSGAKAYVLMNGSVNQTTAPIIVNTTLNGTRISPRKVFSEGDMGVLVFGNVSGKVGGWCSALGYRINATIQNSGGTDLTNFQVPVYIDSSHIANSDTLSTFFTTADADGDNIPIIQIYDSNCNPVNFWVEKWDTSNKKALIWVNVTIPANSQVTLSIYFDSSGTETMGDPEKVFDFYDDFESWNGWSNYKQGKVEHSSNFAYYGSYSLRKYHRNDPNGGYKVIGKTLGRNVILEGYIYRPSNWGGGPADRIGLEDKNYDGYSILVNHNGNYIRLDKRHSGSASQLSLTATWNPPEDKWYFFRMIVSQNQVIMEVYDKDSMDKYNVGVGYIQRVQATDTSYSTFDRVVIHGGYEYYVDSLRIRKYANPMPTLNQYSSIETKPISTVPSGGSARAYDIQPFINCIQDNRYFGIEDGWSFFERLEGSNTNHIQYEQLANATQDELKISYNGKHYPIGLVSFMIPHANYDEKLFNLFTALGIAVEEGQSSVDYYFLNYYFKGGSKISGSRVWGISYGTTSSGDLSTIPFFLDNPTATAIFGSRGAQDLLRTG